MITHTINGRVFYQTDEGAAKQAADMHAMENRNESVYNDWLTNPNIRDLAFRYCMSKQSIYRILDEQKGKRK